MIKLVQKIEGKIEEERETTILRIKIKNKKPLHILITLLVSL